MKKEPKLTKLDYSAARLFQELTSRGEPIIMVGTGGGKLYVYAKRKKCNVPAHFEGRDVEIRKMGNVRPA